MLRMSQSLFAPRTKALSRLFYLFLKTLIDKMTASDYHVKCDPDTERLRPSPVRTLCAVSRLVFGN